ncbi:MAG TPA: thiamine-phosphate kinase [Candidatus Cybelea sp.]|nr:thiamine-phosphate kinase [Candidatus Cybelea sp.]
MTREDQLIERIRRAVPSVWGPSKRGVRLGIGHDAALLAAGGGFGWAVSCDAFLEGIHFFADRHPPDSVGYKSLARAASDLVAMGAKPAYFLLTLGLPAKRTKGWLENFLRGVARAARSLDMRLIGGDTTKARWITANLTVFGRLETESVVGRTGARPGDRLYVSGTLGRAQLGLELMRRGYSRKRALAPQLAPHLYPVPPVELGMWLVRNRVPSAMMDLSDGLSTDLTRLCRASGVGARIRAERIPAVSISPLVRKILGHAAPALTSRKMALDGGDDYQLLFAVPPRRQPKLRKAPGFSRLTCIGETTRDRRVLIRDEHGRTRRLDPAGWDPFRQKRPKKT